MEVQQRINMNLVFKPSRMSQIRQTVAVNGLYCSSSEQSWTGMKKPNWSSLQKAPCQNNTAVQMHSTVHWKFLLMALIFTAIHLAYSQKSCHLLTEITNLHKMKRHTLFILIHVSEFLCLTLWKNKQGIHLLYCSDWCS